MPRTITATEAQNKFGSVLKWAEENQDDVIIERRGNPVAVIIPFEEYEEITRLRHEEAKRRALTSIRILREQVQQYETDPDLERGYRAAGMSESISRATLERDDENLATRA